MSIKAYVGRMGSGKTYELVSVVILGALSRGRRVVSNVAGLDYPAMVDLLVESGIAADKIGELVTVTHDEVLKLEFWRTDKDSEQKIVSFIQPGDLVALDEIWRFWSGFAEKAMPERVMNFFRMHRHFTHSETGVACDVALITQDVMDISRRVRSVIEETYQMTKLTAIGSSKRYRVDVFQGSSIRRKPVKSIQRSYEPKYFPLYSSHSQKTADGAGPVEENIDKRGNILTGIFFKLAIPLAFVALLGGIWMVWGFFHPKVIEKKDKGSIAGQSEKTPIAGQSGKIIAGSPGVRTEALPDGVSARWRVVGIFYHNKKSELQKTSGLSLVIVLRDPAGVQRYLYDPPEYQWRGWQIAVKLPEGGIATNWSGAVIPSAPVS